MPEMGMSADGQGKQDKIQSLRRRFDWLQSLDDNELRDVSFCQEEGEKLRENEVYFDLENPERGQIQGKHGEHVPKGSCFVGKSRVDQKSWEKLTKPFSK